MKWPFRRDDYDEYEPRTRGKRQPQTLKTVAEKILARKMKQDEAYGLQIAEKLLKVAPSEKMSLREQLEELQELKGILQELGGTSDGQTGIMGVVSSLLNSDLGSQLGAAISGMANRPQLDQGLPRIPREALQQPPPPEPPQEEAILLGDLLSLLSMEPEEAVANLPVLWKQKLAGLNYMQVNGLLIEFVDDATWGEMVKVLLSQERKPWLTQLLRLCQEEAKG